MYSTQIVIRLFSVFTVFLLMSGTFVFRYGLLGVLCQRFKWFFALTGLSFIFMLAARGFLLVGVWLKWLLLILFFHLLHPHLDLSWLTANWLDRCKYFNPVSMQSPCGMVATTGLCTLFTIYVIHQLIMLVGMRLDHLDAAADLLICGRCGWMSHLTFRFHNLLCLHHPNFTRVGASYYV